MPFAIILLLFDLTLVAHATATGRGCKWNFIILAIPALGGLAYVAFEIVPEWLNSIEGQKARHGFFKAIDPEKRYRKLQAELAVADVVANRVALAAECLQLGKADEARTHYTHVLTQRNGDEPSYALGKGQAEFALGRFDECLATLDALQAKWPDFRSADGHLLYARALEAGGRGAEAAQEYRRLVDYFPGVEPQVRLGLLLLRQGADAEAKSLLGEVLARMQNAPAHVVRTQRDWILQAQAALRART